MADRIRPEMFAKEADKTQAEIEDEMALKAPGGIPIITGGMKPGQKAWHGEDVLVEVVDLMQPNSKEMLPVSIATPQGALERRIPLNTPTLLPQALIMHLEGNTIEVNQREISPESAMFGNKAIAEAQNPGMHYFESDGRCFLRRVKTRYLVRRVSPVEMAAR